VSETDNEPQKQLEEFSENVQAYKQKKATLFSLLGQAEDLEAMTPENFRLFANGIFEKSQGQKIKNLKQIESLRKDIHRLEGRNRALDQQSDLVIVMVDAFNRQMRLINMETNKMLEDRREKVDKYLETAKRIEEVQPERAKELRDAAKLILQSLDEQVEYDTRSVDVEESEPEQPEPEPVEEPEPEPEKKKKIVRRVKR